MQSWAAPLCDTIRQAHRGQFDADALRAVYAADAVFDDPCGTIRTPKASSGASSSSIGSVMLTSSPRTTSRKFAPAGGERPRLFGGRGAYPAGAGAAGAAIRDLHPPRATIVRFSLPSTIVLDLDVKGAARSLSPRGPLARAPRDV